MMVGVSILTPECHGRQGRSFQKALTLNCTLSNYQKSHFERIWGHGKKIGEKISKKIGKE